MGVAHLEVTQGKTRIKIEANTVLREAIFPTEQRNICKSAKDLFSTSVKVTMLSFAELYAGRLCAALDRQHPRNLFDVKFLFENEGLTNDLRKAFVVYLACDDRELGSGSPF